MKIIVTTAIVAVTAASIGAGAVMSNAANGGSGPAASTDTSGSTSTTTVDGSPSVVEVTRRDLHTRFTTDGVLSFGDRTRVVTNSTGIVSGLPDDGDVPEFATPLFFVDDDPVFVFQGELPQYREFKSGMARGGDILQLEQALHTTTWVDNSELDPNDKIGRSTWNAVDRLYEYFELDEPDTLPVGSLLFVPGPFRVATVNVVNGQRLNGSETIFERTDVSPLVKVAVDPSRLELFPIGARAEVTLPTGKLQTATVSSQSSTVDGSFGNSTGATSDVTLGVELIFDGHVDFELPEFAPVEVSVTRELHPSVLSVPIVALVALAGGGFGVERWDGTARSIVPLEIGASADGFVEVTAGELRAGDLVVVP